MEENKTDYLKEDPPMPGQDWAVVSFVSPNDKVLLKQLHYVNQFMVNDINKTIGAQAMQMAKFVGVKMRNQIEDVLDKLSNSLDDDDKRVYEILKKKYEQLQIDEDEFVHECRRRYELDEEEMMDRYKMYVVENRLEMDKQFDEAHDHVTSVRGFKIRGNFQRLADARDRAKMLRDDVEPAIHAFVVPVGRWFPVDMDADEAQDQEHMLSELNDFMGKYHQNIQNKNANFRQREQSLKENAQRYGQQSTQDRLRKKLAAARSRKMRKEVEDLKRTTITQNSEKPAVARKRRRRRKKKTTETSDSAPAPAPASN